MNLFQYEIVWVIPILIVVSIIWSVIKGRKRAKEMRNAGASLNLREAIWLMQMEGRGSGG
jgi:hypothetical protein